MPLTLRHTILCIHKPKMKCVEKHMVESWQGLSSLTLASQNACYLWHISWHQIYRHTSIFYCFIHAPCLCFYSNLHLPETNFPVGPKGFSKNVHSLGKLGSLASTLEGPVCTSPAALLSQRNYMLSTDSSIIQGWE